VDLNPKIQSMSIIYLFIFQNLDNFGMQQGDSHGPLGWGEIEEVKMALNVQ
jgi:hypothetical protein